MVQRCEAIPLQAWTSLEVSRRLRLPDFNKQETINNKQETIYSTFLTGCCLPYCTCSMLSCLVYIYVSFKALVCIVVSRIACMVIAVLCILWSSYVYLLYCVFAVLCICCTVYLLYWVFVVLCNCCTGCCVFVVLCVLMFLL
jgi:hypothetical protein